ncbi:V/A-type H+-transporting ATPase subunit E [Pelagirhabdus alkalitolerans]|uniref:V/A-type H+-transporting ATPase subunit E n=1 Tax=Pelagirhabdus alkalitolerans TaxID=1612202 RepID=A0A1G6H7C9_9BACI|nr:hypothetical protein [Pelagirhabdus alkalitolerans]SDB90121.1 V/A-type H+-transporting ATPase subunit E [Pelagirhabdus alkalitolerans]
MRDLQALSTQILAKTKEEGQRQLDEYSKVANEKIEEERQKLAEFKENKEAAIGRQLNNDYEREAQTMRNQRRNAVLSEKQTLLSSVFNEASKRMENWDSSQFNKFLEGVLSQLDDNESWSLVPGEKSYEQFKDETTQKILKSYPFVIVSDDVVKQKAGFIIEHGGIDYNFCFDSLVDELKREFSPQLATLAFKSNE